MEEMAAAQAGGGGADAAADGGLKPWEQHSAVIIIPRFDYAAPSSLLDRSRSGFLITCPIKREKSATKEAISILEKHVSITSSKGQETFEPSATNVSAKKRKICSSEKDAKHLEDPEGNESNNDFETSAGKGANGPTVFSSEGDKNFTMSTNLSLVKLTKSGLLLFTFPSNDFRHTVEILSNIFHSLGSGNLKSPLWCHRIFPIQETCLLIEKDLHTVVSKLVREYISYTEDKLSKPIKFAVGYNRRGIDEVQTKNHKSAEGDSERACLLDREECFKVVARAVKDISGDAVVDLKHPELVVLVEVLPLSGVPHGSSVVGVSVLPRDLVTTKPRLCIKALVCDTKGPERKD